MLTVKNEKIGDSELENLLKTKMNELSDSVDCFDRISARAFPQEDNDFSENGFTVSDLENITGKIHRPRLLKWTALAAAAVVCITILPQTGFVRRVFANLGMGSVKKIYQQLITEINSELESGDYIIVDVPLDYYIENDVLVTPLFSCPFEACCKEDANVRLFIKQIDGINTTQMYAALYSGTYTENNIIAAAESNFKFTVEDMTKEFDDTSEYHDSALTAVEMLFGSDENGHLTDNDGNSVSLASFENISIIKDKNGVRKVTSEILYGHNDDSAYFYDILTCGGELPHREEMWKKSVYFNGNSAFPEENQSAFTQTELFDGTDTASSQNSKCTFIYPYDTIIDINYKIDENLCLNGSTSGRQLCSVRVPSAPKALITLKMYFSNDIFIDDSGMAHDDSVTVKDKSNKNVNSFSESEIYMTGDVRNEIFQIKEEIERQNRQIEEENQRHQEQMTE